MAFTGTVTNTAADNTTAAEVDVPQSTDQYSITIYAVDDGGTGTIQTPSAGTADLKVKTRGSSTYETVYQSDGTTAVSVALTGGVSVTVTLTGVAAASFKSAPSSLDAGDAVYMSVSYGSL